MRIVFVGPLMKVVFMQNDKVCLRYSSEHIIAHSLSGWHLPGFDDSKWDVGKPTDGLSSAGVAFYR